jgi:hypothetical protein
MVRHRFTSKIAQVDRLDVVRSVVEAVAAGCTNVAEVAQRADLTSRKARDYLDAAVVLGFVAVGGAAITASTRLAADLLSTAAGSEEEGGVFLRALANNAQIRRVLGKDPPHVPMKVSRIARRLRGMGVPSGKAERVARTLDSWRRAVAAQTPEAVPAHLSQLSKRARGVLTGLNVGTVHELCLLDVEQLRGVRNCGRGTIAEISSFIERARRAPTVEEPKPRHWITSDGVSSLSLLLPVSGFHMSGRASKALASLGVVYVGELIQQTDESIRGIRRCGAATVEELISIVSGLGLRLGTEVTGWDRNLAERLATTNARALTRLRTTETNRRYRGRPNAAMSEEVFAYVRQLTTVNSSAVVIEWLVGDDAPIPKFHHVGQRLGLSRERVRQVVTKLRSQARRARISPPSLSEGLRIAERYAPLTASRLLRLLRERWPGERDLSPSFLLAAAFLFGAKHNLQGERLGGEIALVTRSDPNVINRGRSLARRAVGHWGCSTVEEIVATYTEKYRSNVSADFLLQVIAQEEGFVPLDDDGSWFFLSSVPRNRLVNRIEKILAVCPQIEVSELRSGVSRHYQMEGFAPPKRVLAALCAQLPGCEVAGGIVASLAERDPRHELSATELALWEVLRVHGPVMSVAALARSSALRGLKLQTFQMALFNTPIIKKFAPGVYGLVGARALPGVVDALRPQHGPRRTVLLNHWWTSVATLRIAYRLSEGSLRSGVLSIPREVQSLLSGEYEVRAEDGSRLTVLTVQRNCVWGLLSYFRRRGGEAEDFLTIDFDLGSRRAMIDVGEELALEDTASAAPSSRSPPREPSV